jgi:tetratricopeptide (TPR) repeat protein
MRHPLLIWCVAAAMTIPLLGVGTTPKEIPITTTSKEALTTYMKAMALYENIKLDEARTLFQKTVEIDPKFALAHMYLGLLETTTQAQTAEMNKAISLADNVSEGERLIIHSTREYLDGKPMQGEQLLRKAIAMYPDERRARYILGEILYTRQQYSEAIIIFNEIIKIDPQHAPVYNLLGYAQMYKGDMTAAEKALQKYVELIPNEPNPHDSYAEILMKRGKFDESIEHYRKAIAIDPKFYGSYSGIISNHLFKKEFVEAKTVAQQFFDVAPDDAWRRTALTAMIRVSLFQGNDAQALEQTTRRLELATKIQDDAMMADDHQLLCVIGLHMNSKEAAREVYLKTGSVDVSKLIAARKHIDESLKLNERSSVSTAAKEVAKYATIPLQVELALREYNLESAQKLIREYQKWTESRKDKREQMVVHFLNGRLALAQGNNEEAVKEFEKGNMRNPWTLYWLMESYKMVGNTKQMQEVRSRPIESIISTEEYYGPAAVPVGPFHIRHFIHDLTAKCSGLGSKNDLESNRKSMFWAIPGEIVGVCGHGRSSTLFAPLVSAADGRYLHLHELGYA